MAHKTLFVFPASSMIGFGESIAADPPTPMTSFLGRPALAFDDAANETAVTPEVVMPQGNWRVPADRPLYCDVHYSMATGDTELDSTIQIHVEAKTPNTDTLDMEAATSWDDGNIGTGSIASGDP
ncbi:unnamed protein product, partial [marine sediment metagenome]